MTSKAQFCLSTAIDLGGESAKTLKKYADVLIAEGLAQWLRSLPPNPEVPGSIPGLVEG